MGEYLRRNGRLLLAALVIVLFCAALPGLFAAGQAIETGSWGLSFRAEGKEPVGNASKQALQSYEDVYKRQIWSLPVTRPFCRRLAPAAGRPTP